MPLATDTRVMMSPVQGGASQCLTHYCRILYHQHFQVPLAQTDPVIEGLWTVVNLTILVTQTTDRP